MKFFQPLDSRNWKTCAWSHLVLSLIRGSGHLARKHDTVFSAIGGRPRTASGEAAFYRSSCLSAASRRLFRRLEVSLGIRSGIAEIFGVRPRAALCPSHATSTEGSAKVFCNVCHVIVLPLSTHFRSLNFLSGIFRFPAT